MVTPSSAMPMIDLATQRLLCCVEGLSDSDLRQPSSLPGWSRGHVLAHVAQGADAMRNLLIWAHTGVPLAAYPSQTARDAAIQASAGRSAADLLAELSTSAKRFHTQVSALSEPAWQQRVRVLDGAEFPAVQLLARRLVEIELHHTDLQAGYSPQQWPAAFAEMPLPQPMHAQREHRRRVANLTFS